MKTNNQSPAERAKLFLEAHASRVSGSHRDDDYYARYQSNRIQVNWLAEEIQQAIDEATAALRAEIDSLKAELQCDCRGVELQEYTNQRELRPKDYRVDAWTDKTVCIDACIAEEIIGLWKQGIITNGSCCGHNKAAPFIGVTEEHTDRMRQLGYQSTGHPQSFYPKSVKNKLGWLQEWGDGHWMRSEELERENEQLKAQLAAVSKALADASTRLFAMDILRDKQKEYEEVLDNLNQAAQAHDERIRREERARVAAVIESQLDAYARDTRFHNRGERYALSRLLETLTSIKNPDGERSQETEKGEGEG